jgi:hypothetical protein
LWSKAAIQGKVHPAAGRARVEVAFRSSANEEKVAGSASAELTADGLFQTDIPAGIALDVKVTVPGAAPVYLWGIKSAPGQAASLGVIRPVTGGSISGFVVDVKRRPVAQASIVIAPVTPLGRGTENDTFRSYAAITNARGFFQITGIAAGSYHLSSKKRGYSTADAGLVEIHAGEEREIERPLVQADLQSVEIVITPPVDAKGQPWTVSLAQSTPFSSAFNVTRKSGVPLTGIADLNALESGSYLIAVIDGGGNTRKSEPVVLDSGHQSIAIVIDDILVRGTVRAGKVTVASRLTFSDSSGAQIRATSAADGSYEISLPHDGKWHVEIAPTSVQLKLFRMKSVDIRRGEGELYVPLDIELPAGRLAADVVDSDGKPVDALVDVYRDGTPVAHGFAQTGHIDIFGVPEGAAQVDARTPKSQSELLPVDITDSSTIQLVVRSQRTLLGSVVTVDGLPVAGAILRARSSRFDGVPNAVSAPNGGFELKLPLTDGPVDLVVIAPGFPVRMITIPADYDMMNPARIVVAGIGGRLQVHLSRGAPPWPRIRKSGEAMSITLLFYPPGADGYPGGLTPNGIDVEIEPGTYTVCDPNAEKGCRTINIGNGTAAVIDFRKAD